MEMMEKIDCMGIKALFPIYGEQGENQTLVHTVKGEIFCYSGGMRSFLQKFFRYEGLDLYQLRKKYGELLQRRNGIPIPVGSYLVLVPAKMREPIGRGDGAYGYVALDQVTEIQGEDKKGIFCLEGNVWIPTLWSKKILHQQLLHGRLVKQEYEKEQNAKYKLYHKLSAKGFSVQEGAVMIVPVSNPYL